MINPKLQAAYQSAPQTMPTHSPSGYAYGMPSEPLSGVRPSIYDYLYGQTPAPANPALQNPALRPPRGAPDNAWAVPEGYLGPVSSNSSGDSWIDRKKHNQWVRSNPNKASAWLNGNQAMTAYYTPPHSNP